METEVYGDLYILINGCMDFLCLYLTASLLHLRIRRMRAVLAAAFGGVYALMALLLGMEGITGLLLDVAAALVMCLVAFGARGLRFWRWMQYTAVCFFVSMLLGGIMTALYSALNRLSLPFDLLEGEGVSVWMFVLVTVLSALVAAFGGRWWGVSRSVKSVTLHVRLCGKETVLRAMVDTGNLLRDPVSGKSVIMVQTDRILPLLPLPLRRAIERGGISAIEDYENAKSIRLIPTRGATGTALLPSLTPDELIVEERGRRYEGDYLLAPVALGSSAHGFDAVFPAH